MADEFYTRREHDEYVKRMEDEHKRQNKRIEKLEKESEKNTSLIATIKSLSDNMERMFEEQQRQGERLSALEGRDGERWRQVTGYIITAIVGLAIGCITAAIGL